MAYTITVEDEHGQIIKEYRYDGRNEAIRVAKDAARHEQGRALVSDEANTIIREFKYEDGVVLTPDSDGNMNYA